MTPIEYASQALAMERVYTRLFNRNAGPTAPAKSAPNAEPVDRYEPSSKQATLPVVTYSLRGGT